MRRAFIISDKIRVQESLKPDTVELEVYETVAIGPAPPVTRSVNLELTMKEWRELCSLSYCLSIISKPTAAEVEEELCLS